MKTIQILQYVSAMLATAAMVAAGALGWDLSPAAWATLGGISGLMLKRPSDMSAVKKALPEE
jgi:hypothetical protein